jgi:hypothetical protein
LLSFGGKHSSHGVRGPNWLTASRSSGFVDPNGFRTRLMIRNNKGFSESRPQSFGCLGSQCSCRDLQISRRHNRTIGQLGSHQ